MVWARIGSSLEQNATTQHLIAGGCLSLVQKHPTGTPSSGRNSAHTIGWRPRATPGGLFGANGSAPSRFFAPRRMPVLFKGLCCVRKHPSMSRSSLICVQPCGQRRRAADSPGPPWCLDPSSITQRKARPAQTPDGRLGALISSEPARVRSDTASGPVRVVEFLACLCGCNLAIPASGGLRRKQPQFSRAARVGAW